VHKASPYSKGVLRSGRWLEAAKDRNECCDFRCYCFYLEAVPLPKMMFLFVEWFEKSWTPLAWRLEYNCFNRCLLTRQGSPANHAFAVLFLSFFKRVSWWRFWVSTWFSLVCLILLTDFHKKQSFRSNMLNYLNTTFAKHSKDNSINRKFHCSCSFIQSFSCLLFVWGESRGQHP